jgi:uncharacterized damage-inducible protein DinB
MRKAFLIEQFDAELAPTREVLLTVPAIGLDWKPHPSSFSIGRVAMHVASIPGWVAAFTEQDGYDMGAGGPGPAIPATHAEIVDKFERSVARGHAALAGIAATALGDPWTLLRDGETIARMTRAEAIARYVVRHLVHHRGQLTVYLRLRAAPVPAIYGDSADRRLLPMRSGV